MQTAMHRNQVWILPVVFILSGCADWALKERCENTNWYNYAQEVAYGGKYLEEDGFVKDCKKLDRTNAVQLDQGFKLGREKLCTYDEIFHHAEQGIPVFFDFCTGLNPTIMKGRYSDGLKTYCTPNVGYTFGKSGKVYQNVCPANIEKNFLPSYFKGRREFLLASIASLKVTLATLEPLQREIINSESRLSKEISALPNAQECSNKIVWNELLKQNESRTICSEAGYVRNMRYDLMNQMGILRARQNEVNGKVGNYIAELRQNQKDLDSLPIQP